MAATYPGLVKSFTTKIDNIDTVYAAHPNDLQNEIIAIESTLGTNPQIAPTISGTWISGAYSSWNNLGERLANIERGVVADAHPQYVKIAGGSTINIATSSTTGLVIKANSSQGTKNLLEFQPSGSTAAIAYITPAGGLVDTKVTADINNLYVLSYVFG